MTLNKLIDQRESLKKALQLAKGKGRQGFFVFDMDSTLFCMKYRTEAIIKNCLKDPVFCSKFPESLDIIRQVEVTKRDWSVREILSRYGCFEGSPLSLAVEKIWRKHFFTNDYLHLDKPYKGAALFAQHVCQQGASLYYLTARSRKSMGEGTVQSLKKWDFPLPSEKSLIMKEDSAKEDGDYKLEHLKKLLKKSDTVLFFENEPVILNKVAQALPQIHLFWMDSAHSRQEKPPETAFPLSMDWTWQKSCF